MRSVGPVLVFPRASLFASLLMKGNGDRPCIDPARTYRFLSLAVIGDCEHQSPLRSHHTSDVSSQQTRDGRCFFSDFWPLIGRGKAMGTAQFWPAGIVSGGAAVLASGGFWMATQAAGSWVGGPVLIPVSVFAL